MSGVLTPGYSLLDDIRQDIVDLYPSDIHKRANGKVVLVVMHEKELSPHYINHFSSKDELVEACFASSYVPYLTGKSPEVYRGTTDYIDGGLVVMTWLLDPLSDTRLTCVGVLNNTRSIRAIQE